MAPPAAALALDHLFVCCAPGAPEAEALVRLGLEEGSPNRHPGQGTACRRFFFAHAYLELLWVEDEREARSEGVGATRLWERWSTRGAGASPFGIVLRPGVRGAPPAPFATWTYRAAFFPAEFPVELAVGTPLAEPEVVYLPAASATEHALREPVNHALELSEVTGLVLELPGAAALSPPARALAGLRVAQFEAASRHAARLVFDGGVAGLAVDLRPELPLVLEW